MFSFGGVSEETLKGQARQLHRKFNPLLYRRRGLFCLLDWINVRISFRNPGLGFSWLPAHGLESFDCICAVFGL